MTHLRHRSPVLRRGVQPTLLLSLVALGVAVAAASCGSTIRDDDDAAASGVGAAGGGSSTASCSSGNCPPDSAMSSSSSGTGSKCSGFEALTCPSGEFCDYPDDFCGGLDGSGTCVPEPQGCDLEYNPVCACDGKVYGNACEANAAGFDVSTQGNCTPPGGSFLCGAHLCELATQYCQFSGSDTGDPPTWACIALPPGCTQPATCACLANEPCADFKCEQGAEGGLTLTCPGG